MANLETGLKAQIEQLKQQMAELQAEVEQHEQQQDSDPAPLPRIRKKRTMKTVPNAPWEDVVQMVEFVVIQRWMDYISKTQGDWSDPEEICTGERVQEELLEWMVIHTDQVMLWYDQLPNQVQQQNSIDTQRMSLLRAYMLTVGTIDGSFNHADILNSLAGLGELGKRLASDLFWLSLSELLAGDRRDSNGDLHENKQRREALAIVKKQAEIMQHSGIVDPTESRRSIHWNPAQNHTRSAATYEFKKLPISAPQPDEDSCQLPMPF